MPAIGAVGVLGGGLMGSGIAAESTRAGHETTVWEPTQEALDAAISSVRRLLDRLLARERISPDEHAAALSRIHGTIDLDQLSNCGIIVEAVLEDLDLKIELWQRLDDVCPQDTVFASNTSSLSITRMAAATRRPGRVVGVHFFNPVTVMKLVELVPTLGTDSDALQRARDFATSLDKEVIEARDTPGFIVNRLLVPYMMDAIRALEEGLGSVRDIDLGMTLGAGHPMGPLTLCDFVGNDTLHRIGEIMYREYREPRFASPPLLGRMVALGLLGRKAGKGFYDYGQEPPVPVDLGL